MGRSRQLLENPEFKVGKSFTKTPKVISTHMPLLKRPYKFLDYYDTNDSDIFFGRKQEIHKMCSLIHTHPLVLLFGASGTGKTSLLLAGVAPRLAGNKSSYEIIYARTNNDPILIIRKIIERHSQRASLPEDSLFFSFG